MGRAHRRLRPRPLRGCVQGLPPRLTQPDSTQPNSHHQPNPTPAGITRESPSKGYFPFGYSTRSCIGATLALIEGTVMITLLAQRYTFKEVRARSRFTDGVV